MKNKTAVKFKNITMQFPGIKALDDVSFDVEKGSIHAIIGENGAGKSTLMSVLFGLYHQTKGITEIDGIERTIKDPNHATLLGIGMVHQHFKIVDIYSNLDNIILGYETKKNGFLYKKEAIRKIEGIQNEFNFKFNLKNKSGKESVGVQQKVEIMKMLYRDAEILVFDEPTAVLTPQEIDGLLETMKDFKKKGKTILFISHKLNEVKAVADNATIIRKGKVVDTVSVAKTSINKMAEMMVGSKVVNVKNLGKSNLSKKPYLKIENLNAKINDKSIKNLSIDVYGGEIHAIAGIEGNGQMILEETISGLNKSKSGTISIYNPFSVVSKSLKNIRVDNNLSILDMAKFIINNKTIKKGNVKNQVPKLVSKIERLKSVAQLVREWESNSEYPTTEDIKKITKIFKLDSNYWDNQEIKYNDITHYSIRKRMSEGIAYIPGDRHKYALLLDENISNNMILRTLDSNKFSFLTYIKNGAKNDFYRSVETEYDVRGGRDGISSSRSLSGGNQQKAVVGREMKTPHQILLVVQPTRGLDIGAINNIHEKLLEEKRQGKAILLISYELDEVMSLADRISVISEGKILDTMPSQNASRNKIGLLMAGITKEGKWNGK